MPQQEKQIIPLIYLPLQDYTQQERAQKVINERKDEENYFIDNDPGNGIVFCLLDTEQGRSIVAWVKGEE